MTDLSKSVDQFKEYQTQRVHVYNYFETKFLEYLQTGYQKIYQQHVMAITRQFQEISENIKKVQELFKKDKENIYEIIQKIQNLEREKLKLTIEMQLLRQEYHFSKKKKQEMILHELELNFDKNINEKKLKMNEINQEINDNLLEISE